jgi:hypothetical protein
MGRPDRPKQTDNAVAHLRESLRQNFAGAYMAVNEQLLQAERRPAAVTVDIVAALGELLTDPGRFATARQRYFLLKQAALTLATVYTADGAPRVAARLAHRGLRQALMTTQGPALRAAAGALGSLPVTIPQPERPPPLSLPRKGLPVLDCDELLHRARIKAAAAPYFMGRTLILPSRDGADLVAVKLARSGDDAPHLANEAFWLKHLSTRWRAWAQETDLHIPTLLPANGTPLFHLRDLPFPEKGKGSSQLGRMAIAFKTKVGYFTYPNDARPSRRPSPADLLAIMARNARQMGALASRGILHTAPIPLFHNRIQRHRRPDGGRYQWYRAGRLDRWLTSCAYPNMGLTGLRDFEHLEPHCGSSEKLYREIGTHFLSFLLVAGAYFRSAAPQRMGLDEAGRPVDARDLFDPQLLERLVRTIFSNYYQGFTGQGQAPALRDDIDRLCHRMVAEMGQDRHMIEILRAEDQREMDQEAFVRFLREGGMPAAIIAGQKQGAADIELVSGPHLGNFNRQISLPELTDAVGVMAALCMDGRHTLDRELLP